MKPIDIILIAAIAVLVLVCIKSASKHFKGEGGCCGGGSEILPEPDKKLDNPAIGNYTIQIDGMTCENCVNRVKKALNKIDGVSATVNLRKKSAFVTFDRQIDQNQLVKTIENLDYKVVSVK